MVLSPFSDKVSVSQKIADNLKKKHVLKNLFVVLNHLVLVLLLELLLLGKKVAELRSQI